MRTRYNSLKSNIWVRTSSAPMLPFPKPVPYWLIFDTQQPNCNMNTKRQVKDKKKTFLPVSNRKKPEWACGLWLAPLTSERWFIDRSCCSNMLTSSAPLHLTLTNPRQPPAITGETVAAAAGPSARTWTVTAHSRFWRVDRRALRSSFSISQWLIRRTDQEIAWLWHYYSVNAREPALIRLDGPQKEELNQGDEKMWKEEESTEVECRKKKLSGAQIKFCRSGATKFFLRRLCRSFWLLCLLLSPGTKDGWGASLRLP